MARPTIFARPRARDRSWLRERLRDETFGGFLLLAAAMLALLWANSPWADAYFALVNTVVGPSVLHLDLTIGTWVADAVLAVFFFAVGLELKHELVVGTLSDLREAAVPVAAAVGGMVVPALIYVAFNRGDNGVLAGWGIPMATDIAFALAVLAVVGRGLPLALRAFLLTSAVVDDLGAILVIALFYSDKFVAAWLLGAIACFVLYAFAQRRRWTSPWFYIPLALIAWWMLHNSGVHATIAGVTLGMLTRVRPDDGEAQSPVDRLQHRVHPISAGLAVPLFAFTAAGVTIDTSAGNPLQSPVALGVMVALIVGKPIGIVGVAWLATRFTSASLSSDIKWLDVFGVGLVAGIGFTVSLLIAKLGLAPEDLEVAKIAILLGSLLSAVLAAVVLTRRSRWYAAQSIDE